MPTRFGTRIVSRERKTRTINVAQSAIPFSRGETTGCLLHRYIGGYLLVELNDANEPTRAYSDSRGIHAIRTTHVSRTTMLAERVIALRPQRLYLNDAIPFSGVSLRTLNPNTGTRIQPYVCDLMSILNESGTNP